MKQDNDLLAQYEEILRHYLWNRNEEALYQAQKFSRKLLEAEVSPDEALSLHIEAMRSLYENMSDDFYKTFDFLLEVMMGYGLAYREYQSLRSKQQQLESDIDVAANMQQTLLRGEIPSSSHLDIGALSQPANKMSGDYFHFVQDEKDAVSIALADIIGKGIPAALSMSMIKYAMDSVPEQRMQPSAILENLNRVVEQNVDPSMFITMFYGIYDPRVHRFYFSSAGHEPGFFYSAQKDCFTEMEAKGLILGVSRATQYREYEETIDVGDMMILLSDGVTECRTEKGFVTREEITALIRSYLHLSAQQIVERVYYDLERLQNFQLRDDFTLIVLKRKV